MIYNLLVCKSVTVLGFAEIETETGAKLKRSPSEGLRDRRSILEQSMGESKFLMT